MTATTVFTQDQLGAVLRVTITENGAAKDISGASSITILVQKPSGTVDTHTASFTTDGTDGAFEYATAAGDLDEAGTYEWQGRAVISGTEDVRSLRQSFYVQEKLS